MTHLNFWQKYHLNKRNKSWICA